MHVELSTFIDRQGNKNKAKPKKNLFPKYFKNAFNNRLSSSSVKTDT